MEFPFVNIHTHSYPNLGELALMNVHQPFSDLSAPYLSVGMHPWHIKEPSLSEDWKRMQECLTDHRVLAIGECGLDRLCNTPWQLQRRVFQKQISMADEFQLPMLIHCVRAQDEVLAELKQSDIPFVFHGFNGKVSRAINIVEAGGYIGLSASFLQSEIKCMGLQEIPLNKVFLETDTKSIWIGEVYALLAERLKIEVEWLKNRLYQNTIELGLNWNKNERY